MGQAKKRGTAEQRHKQALARRTPTHVHCNNCNTLIAEMIPLDTKELTGIDIAAYGMCTACNQITWAISGDPELVALFHEMVADGKDPSEVKDRIQRSPLGKD